MKNIKFEYGVSANNLPSNNVNRWYYNSIKNGTTIYSSSTLQPSGSDLFIKSGISDNVRICTLPEINKALGRDDIAETKAIMPEEDPDNLFQLTTNQSKYPGISHNGGVSGGYFVASPYPDEYYEVITYVGETGTFLWNTNSSGARPVVHLIGDKMQLTEVENGTYKFTPVD